MTKFKGLKIIGITVSITWIMLIALMFFVNAIRIIWGDWFANHAIIIAVVSGIIVFLGIVTGAISLKALVGNGKGIFT